MIPLMGIEYVVFQLTSSCIMDFFEERSSGILHTGDDILGKHTITFYFHLLSVSTIFSMFLLYLPSLNLAWLGPGSPILSQPLIQHFKLVFSCLRIGTSPITTIFLLTSFVLSFSISKM